MAHPSFLARHFLTTFDAVSNWPTFENVTFNYIVFDIVETKIIGSTDQ